MYSFSNRSQSKLATCDQQLQDVFNEVIKYVDCTVLEGYRGQDVQDDLCHRGLSKLSFPDSKHNRTPSAAVDVSPHPIDWKNLSRFVYFGGIVMGVALKQGIRLRWGGDWNRNFNPSDETFLDYVHFELED